MAGQDQGAFTRTPLGDGALLLHLRPARPPLAFLASVALLGGLFGLPALAVLIDPARHDALSLGAALGALLVLGLAALAWRRARRGRGRREIRLDAAGILLPEGRLAWTALRGLRVEAPPPAATLPGPHGLGAGIAAQQRASEARLWLDRRDASEPALVAGGLGLPVAEALREAILDYRDRLPGPM
ncbi:hypothetical protein [Pseudoroseomonas sp. WGS1072]|uniref:hypothetical protein n=1 Tax=Roseomonas sp. WGS1072 TaxID=3366816 RepID=UPI003BF3A2F3